MTQAPARAIRLPNKGYIRNGLPPNDLNDFGMMVGFGTFKALPRAFLMTPVYADFDRDRDTDLNDFTQFQPCMTAPSGAIGAEFLHAVGGVGADRALA